jgi:hypothetical protein
MIRFSNAVSTQEKRDEAAVVLRMLQADVAKLR